MATRIPDQIIDVIRDNADIVDIISRYIQLKKTGRNFVGLCPFHSEKTPSFSVSPEKGIFYCFGCGKGGNVFKFLMEYENLSFVESVRYLAEQYHISIPEEVVTARPSTVPEEDLEIYYRIQQEALNYFLESLHSPAGQTCREYLEKRGISKETADTFQLGYAPPGWEGFVNLLKQKKIHLKLAEQSGLIIHSREKEGYYDRFRDRLMFPIHSITGRVLAFGGRSLDNQEPKYLNSPETPVYIKGQNLYGLHRAKQKIRKLRYTMMVEGYMDLIALAGAGIENVVATLGTALTPQQARLLKRFTRQVALMFDTDDAGIKAALRGIEIFTGIGVQTKVVHLPGEKDPDDFLREKGLEEFKTVFAQAPGGIEFVFSHFLKKPESKTPHGKAQAVSEIVPYLSKIQDPVARAEYVRQFAETSRIDEHLIVEKMKELAKRRQYGTGTSEKKKTANMDRTEKQLVQCIILQPELLGNLFKKIDMEEIHHPRVKESLEALSEKLDQGTTYTSAKLIDHFGSFISEDITAGISFALNQPVENDDGEEHQDDDQENDQQDKTAQIFLDCLIKIRKRFMERQLKEITLAIKEADKQGNNELIDSLSRKKEKLKSRLLKKKYF